MAIIKLKDVPKLRAIHKDKKIIFCSGTFDLPHVGHVLFLEECKKYGEILIVGLGKDEIVKRLKGKKRPILNQYIRLKTIDSFKPVDYTFLQEIDKVGQNPLQNIGLLLKKLKPDLYIINNDAFDISYRQEFCKKYGIKLMILKRSCPKKYENISTTNLIKKIQDLKQ